MYRFDNSSFSNEITDTEFNGKMVCIGKENLEDLELEEFLLYPADSGGDGKHMAESVLLFLSIDSLEFDEQYDCLSFCCLNDNLSSCCLNDNLSS